MTSDRNRAIFEMHKRGLSYKVIAQTFNISAGRVGQVIEGQKRAERRGMIIVPKDDKARRMDELLKSTKAEYDERLRVLNEWYHSERTKIICDNKSENAPDVSMLIETLNLSNRTHNALMRTGMTTIAEVLELFGRGPDALLAIRNFGHYALDELTTRLKEENFIP